MYFSPLKWLLIETELLVDFSPLPTAQRVSVPHQRIRVLEEVLG